MRSLLFTLLALLIFFVGRHFYFQPKFMMGVQVPDFQTELIDGQQFELTQLTTENVVLLDFWGSWCGPCRADSPKLVELYQQYHGKEYKDFNDFEIVSVAIETKEAAWKNAIAQDQLSWPYHIGQMDRFSSPIASLYGVKEIPTTYLISPGGRIAGVNMTFDQLKTYLDSKIASK